MTARANLLGAVAALAAALAGCNGGAATVSATPPRAVDEVDDILILAGPTATNWDNRPGADGLDVNVYLYRYARDLPVIVKGTLEFTLYEGVVRSEDLAEARHFRKWRFDADSLKQCMGHSQAGWGYRIRLSWSPAVPATTSVTLASRYVSRGGRIAYARPITIATRAP